MRDPRAWRIKHLSKNIAKFQKEMDDKKSGLVKFSPHPTRLGPPSPRCQDLGFPFDVAEGKEKEAEAALKEMDEFAGKKVQIDQPKLAADFILNLREWSVNELEALEPILEEPKDVGTLLELRPQPPSPGA